MEGKGIHWLAPCIMLGSLLFGLLRAVGHHLFYNSLQSKMASTGTYNVLNSNYSGQQLNTAVGTAFAFLVKAAFTLSVSTSNYQAFWKAARREHEAGQLLTLGRLDTAFSATGNLLALLYIPLWCRCPLNFLLVAIVWLLPIASIIAPATLTVDVAESSPSITSQRVPEIDFSSLNLVNGLSVQRFADNPSYYYTYNGPSEIAQRIACDTAVQGVIQPIIPPFPNSSWESTFLGPTLQRSDVPESLRLGFQENIAQYLRNVSCLTPPAYLAWYPRYSHFNRTTFLERYVPITPNSSDGLVFDTPDSIFNPIDGLQPDQNLTMYMVIMPNMWQPAKGISGTPIGPLGLACDLMAGIEPTTAASPLGSLGENATMIQCQLFNSTYQTRFNYTNLVQSVQIDILNDRDNPVPAINVVEGPSPNSSSCDTLNIEYDLNETSRLKGSPCNYQSDVLYQVSYQGILQAFTTLLTDNVSLSDYQNAPVDASKIRSTGLVNTRELKFLTDYALLSRISTEANTDLQHVLWQANMSAAGRMTKLPTGALSSTLSLSDALEQMFQNFTVSLMSSAELQPNHSSPLAPPMAQVTLVEYTQVYVYAVSHLWIAYGIATVLTIFAVTIGLFAIFANAASYSNNFSTIFRVSRMAELSAEMDEREMDGRDPLPPYLAEATVVLTKLKDDDPAD